MNDLDLQAALRRLDPGAPRADLVDRAFRRAMAAGRAVTLAERFVGAGRRLVLGSVAVAAAVWIGLYLRTPAEPVVVVLSMWTGDEVGP
jgi:hypothetical protein